MIHFLMLNFHPKQFKMFKDMSANDNLAHAFLFTGPEGVGKLEFARQIAAWLQFEDGGVLDPSVALREGGPDIIETPSPLPIEDAQDLKKRLYTSPFSGKYKIVIIPAAHNMHTDAANSLLKMIEEPRGDTIFILCSSYPEIILETIRSRCTEMKFLMVADEVIEKELNTEPIKELKLHWSGRPGFAKRMLDDKDYRKKIKGYRTDWDLFFKNSLSESFKISEKYAKMEDRRDVAEALRVWMEIARSNMPANEKLLSDLLNIYQNLMTTNVNVRYALEGLSIKKYAK
ncbi:MAG: AAA family ATPase [Candidatus Spechtbacterales bacterium]